MLDRLADPAPLGSNTEPAPLVAEIASILARGYLRLLLATPAIAPSSDVCASCGPPESLNLPDSSLDGSENKSVHCVDAPNP